MYYLPATAVSGNISFIPTSCALYGGKMKFKYEISDAKTTYSTVADEEQRYYVDYGKLNSAIKITTASFEFYPIGTLKTVNAEIDDRTGETLAAIAGSALNIVKAATFVPVQPAAAGTPGETAKCAEPIDRLLKDLMVQRSLLADLNREEAPGTENVNAEPAKEEVPKTGKKTPAAPATASTQRKARAGTQAIATAAAVKPTAEMVQKRINALLQTLTGETSFSYIPSVLEQCSKVTLTGENYLAKFLDIARSDEYEKLHTARSTMGGDAAFEALVCAESTAKRPRTQMQRLSGSGDAAHASGQGTGGILYRQPVMGRITIKKGEGLPPVLLSNSPFSIPQYGTLASLDLSNGPFDKNSIKALFAPDGALTLFEFKAQSTAERGATTLETLSSKYADLAKARDEAAAARTKIQDDQAQKAFDEEIKGYENRMTLLKAKDDFALQVKEKTPLQLEMDDLERKTQLLQKQTNYQNALNAYKKLQEVTP
ncbi:hypothetical protein [Janthinobacterium sp. RB2P8]|uniref:hypothetical protein n=1 Tax=Janthinobacterium sp. RB2P8 TaxID=3424191 RepID=UPI003F1F0CBB